MKTLAKPTRINITQSKSGVLCIRRNGNLELIVENASPEFHAWFVRVLQKEKDYDRYLEFYGYKNEHLSSWLFDIIGSFHEDPWLLEEVRKSGIRSRGTV